MRKEHHSSIIFRVALILLCLVLFSAHLSSGMLAKYSVSATGGDSARVAKTSISVLPGTGFEPDTTGNVLVDVTASGLASFAFKVENSSEIAIKYDILVYFNDCYEEGVLKKEVAGTYTDLQLDGVDYDALEDDIYVFSDVGSLVPGETSDDLTLTMQLINNAINPGTFSGSSSVGLKRYRMPFVVVARATQID